MGSYQEIRVGKEYAVLQEVAMRLQLEGWRSLTIAKRGAEWVLSGVSPKEHHESQR